MIDANGERLLISAPRQASISLAYPASQSAVLRPSTLTCPLSKGFGRRLYAFGLDGDEPRGAGRPLPSLSGWGDKHQKGWRPGLIAMYLAGD